MGNLFFLFLYSFIIFLILKLPNLCLSLEKENLLSEFNVIKIKQPGEDDELRHKSSTDSRSYLGAVLKNPDSLQKPRSRKVYKEKITVSKSALERNVSLSKSGQSELKESNFNTPNQETHQLFFGDKQSSNNEKIPGTQNSNEKLEEQNQTSTENQNKNKVSDEEVKSSSESINKNDSHKRNVNKIKISNNHSNLQLPKTKLINPPKRRIEKIPISNSGNPSKEPQIVTVAYPKKRNFEKIKISGQNENQKNNLRQKTHTPKKLSSENVEKCCYLISEFLLFSSAAIEEILRFWTGSPEILEEMLLQALTSYGVIYESDRKCKLDLIELNPLSKLAREVPKPFSLREDEVHSCEREYKVRSRKEYESMKLILKIFVNSDNNNTSKMNFVKYASKYDLQCAKYLLEVTRQMVLAILRTKSRVLFNEKMKLKTAIQVYHVNEIMTKEERKIYDRFILEKEIESSVTSEESADSEY